MVDTSAVIAILTDEPDGNVLLDVLAAAESKLMSAGTLIELGIVLEARIGPAAPGIVERFLRDGGIDVVPVDRTTVDRALEGWRRFGRGRHPAALNLGDLFGYGLAITVGYPILCTGADFAASDVEVAPPRSPGG